MKISITRALAELKLLDKRIGKEINNLDPATAVVKDELTSDKSQLFKDTADKKLDKIQALIKNSYIIKSAIIMSNAATSVEIGGKSMTVAEAIAKKDLIEFETDLRSKINYNIVQYTAAAERSEASVRAKGEQIAAALAGEDKAMFDSVYQSYMNKNTTTLLVSDKIAKANDDIDVAVDEFETEVDFILSESNTRTTIDVAI